MFPLETDHSIRLRFDSDLSQGVNEPLMKEHQYYYKPDFYYDHALSPEELERIAIENVKLTNS